MIVNIYEAKTRLSQYIARALQGEELIIAKNGKALVKLCPVGPEKKKRAPGLSASKIEFDDDFDAPLDDSIISEFEK